MATNAPAHHHRRERETETETERETVREKGEVPLPPPRPPASGVRSGENPAAYAKPTTPLVVCNSVCNSVLKL